MAARGEKVRNGWTTDPEATANERVSDRHIWRSLRNGQPQESADGQDRQVLTVTTAPPKSRKEAACVAAVPSVHSAGDGGETEAARLQALYARRLAEAGPQQSRPETKQPDAGAQRGLGRPRRPGDDATDARLSRLLRGVQTPKEPEMEGREGVGVGRSPEPQPDRGGAAAAPSLVLCSETWREPEICFIGVDEICPKRPYVMVARDDPTIRRPASCDCHGCEKCGPRKARTTIALATWAIRNADWARFVTLTLAPPEFKDCRDKMNQFARNLRRSGYEWQWLWSVEAGGETGMIHTHALQWGDYVPQAFLQDLWGAIVDIRAIRTGGAPQYAMKEAVKVGGYVLKGAVAEADHLADHLALNGGRPAHWSRGFWHGKNKRGALAAMSAELGGVKHDWCMVPYDFDTEPALAAAAEDDWPL